MRAREDILNFEEDLGLRDWQAFARKLRREGKGCWWSDEAFKSEAA